MPADRRAKRPLPGPGQILAGQISYQMRLIARTPRAVWGGLMLPVLLLTIRHKAGQHPAQQDLAVTGAAIFGLVSTAYVTHATGLVAAREAGVLKRWRATPVPRWCFFAGRSFATLLLATASGLVTVLVAILLYHLRLTTRGAIAIVITLILGAAAWSAIGTAVTALIPSTDAAWPILGLSYLPVIIISGAFGQISEPNWLTHLVSYLPAQPIIHAALHALQTNPTTLISGHDLTILIAWTGAGLIASIQLFQWEPHPPKRHREARA
jgi:ABC-2 type transport system permease protein